MPPPGVKAWPSSWVVLRSASSPCENLWGGRGFFSTGGWRPLIFSVHQYLKSV
jgi:hypothetical protein